MSRYVSVKLVRIWGQIIDLNQTIPAEVDTKYLRFMPLSEMTNIPVSFKWEFLSAPNTISRVMSRNTHLIIPISHVVRLFTKLIYFTIISDKIQLLFNVTQ